VALGLLHQPEVFARRCHIEVRVGEGWVQRRSIPEENQRRMT
jgi:hypothetical protein